MTKIILTGTFHFPDRFDIFSSGVQEQIEMFVNQLKKFNPTKIAVEMSPRNQRFLNDVYEKFNAERINEQITLGEYFAYGEKRELTALNEIVQVGFRLAKKLRHSKIFCVDEDLPLSDELAEKVMPSISEQIAKLARYTNAQFEKSSQTIRDLYEIHNCEGYISMDHNLYISANKVNSDGKYEGAAFVSQWYERNLKIFSNIQNICEQDDVLLVLIGSSHIKILSELVNSSDEMELVTY